MYHATKNTQESNIIQVMIYPVEPVLGDHPFCPPKVAVQDTVVSHNRSDTNHVLPMCKFLHIATQ